MFRAFSCLFYRMNSYEGVEGLTSQTLYNDSSLKEQVKLPVNTTVEEYFVVFVCNIGGFIRTSYILFRILPYSMIRTKLPIYFIFRIADECTRSSCPEMTAGPHYTYLWTDARGGNPVSVSVELECKA